MLSFLSLNRNQRKKTGPLFATAASLADISEMVLQLQGTMMKMENFQKLLELKKDLTGIDDLAVPSRVSVRFDTISRLLVHVFVL